MKLSARTKSRIVGYLDNYSAMGLKVGISALILFAGFLAVMLFGGRVRKMASMKAADRTAMILYIDQVVRLMVWAYGVVVVSAIVRVFWEEQLGQILSLAGILFYFGSPCLIGQYAASQQEHYTRWVLADVASGARLCGAVALLPGLFLVVRDAIIRIWTGISVRRVMDRRWGDEEERRKKFIKPKPYGSCWDMPFCREFVRRVCPAFEARKPCWRMKCGCYCDEKTILKAMTSNGKGNDHLSEIMHTLGLDEVQKTTKLSASVKRARCRRCMIYSEHQRQKYRIVSPLVFPLIALAMYVCYGDLKKWLWVVLEKADSFMRYLAYSPGSHYSFADQGQFLTNVALVWVSIVALSYALKFVEYLVFELQV